MSALDRQVAGRHYQGMAVQPVEFILANDMGFCEGSALKYFSRWRRKGGVEDLRKGKHFVEILLEAAPALAGIRTEQPHRKPSMTAEQYNTRNHLTGDEAAIVRWLYFWTHNKNPDGLRRALVHADALIVQATRG